MKRLRCRYKLLQQEKLSNAFLFSNKAFIDESPIAQISQNNLCVPKPEYAALVRAAYDPVLPVSSQDKSHALRLFARSNIFVSGMNK